MSTSVGRKWDSNPHVHIGLARLSPSPLNDFILDNHVQTQIQSIFILIRDLNSVTIKINEHISYKRLTLIVPTQFLFKIMNNPVRKYVFSSTITPFFRDLDCSLAF